MLLCVNLCKTWFQLDTMIEVLPHFETNLWLQSPLFINKTYLSQLWRNWDQFLRYWIFLEYPSPKYPDVLAEMYIVHRFAPNITSHSWVRDMAWPGNTRHLDAKTTRNSTNRANYSDVKKWYVAGIFHTHAVILYSRHSIYLPELARIRNWICSTPRDLTLSLYGCRHVCIPSAFACYPSSLPALSTQMLSPSSCDKHHRHLTKLTSLIYPASTEKMTED